MIMTPNQFLLKFILSCFIFTQLLFPITSFAKSNNQDCVASSCGSIRNISYPFRLKGDPQHCGHPNCQLVCQHNAPILYFGSNKYIVKAINYNNYTIRLVDSSITDDTCSFPNASLAPFNFTYHFGPQNYPYSVTSHIAKPYTKGPYIMSTVSFMSCSHDRVNLSHLTPISSSCPQYDQRKRYAYIKHGCLNGSDTIDMCRIDAIVMTSLILEEKKINSGVSVSEIHGSLMYGFELSWFPVFCRSWCHSCWLNGANPQCGHVTTSCWGLTTWCGSRPVWFSMAVDWIAGIVMCAVYGLPLHQALKVLIGFPCVMVLLIYKFRRRHLSMFDAIETFLQRNNNLMPIRYSYSNIKRMTRGFREKLGEGGYGSVYKGKLRSGHDVAVKLLKKPKINPQDFINEVATIGRIHHVNVVKLVGYCVEGSRCALIYDFMINGSLDKYLFSQGNASSLSLEKRHKIAVGVARGIDYLHEGCNIRILHFDIKPHNILLDHNFEPKLSDFGLAKSYSTERSMVTLTAARGTIGYVAPELMNRSIGKVSSKVDVYSFGMLLLEMVGLKREIAANDGESSKYFPYWIYDCFENGIDIETGDASEIVVDDEYGRIIRRKMTIVGLWCIHMSPDERPSMNKVVKLLECETEKIEIPPHPSKSPLFVKHCSNAWETSDSIHSITSLADDA